MSECTYWVKWGKKKTEGKWLTESQLKKVLNDGLLDQLIVNHGVTVPNFKIDPNYEAAVASKKRDIKVRIVAKINAPKNINNEKVVTESGLQKEGVKRNPNDVLKKARKDSGKKIPFILVVRVGNELRIGEASKQAIKTITESEIPILEKLKEGAVYMLVPSAYGAFPVQLWSNFIGETKKAKEVTTLLRQLFTAKDEESAKKYAEFLSSFFYRIHFEKTDEGVTTIIEKYGQEAEIKTWETLESLTEYIVGAYENQKYIGEINDKGERVHPGRIALVDHTKINAPGQNIKYANDNFITTDLYTEDGNFFHSSSFVLEAYNLGTTAQEKLREDIKNADPIPATKEVSEAATEKTVTTSKVTNQKTKKDEAATYVMPISELINKGITKHIIVREWQEPNKKMTLQAEVTATINKDGKLSIDIDSIIRREGINGKYKVVKKPFTRKEKNKIIQSFFAFEDVQELQKELAENVIKNTPEKAKEVEVEPKTEKEIETKTEEVKGHPKTVDVKEDDISDLLGTYPDIDVTDQTIEIDPTQEKNIDEIISSETFVDPTKGTDFNISEIEGEDYTEDSDTKTKLVSKKIDGTKWSKEKELSWLEEKLGKETVGKTKTFKNLSELKKYLPKETYEQLIRAKKQGKVLHGLFTQAATHLNENAFEGTGYHEAFHIVFTLVLPFNQRIDILQEAAELYADKLSKNPTYRELEEFLADLFMEYVQTDEATYNTLGKKIKTFFRGIFRAIKLFFAPNSKLSIETIFKDIQLGIYKNRVNFKNTDVSKITKEQVKFRETAGISLLDNPKNEKEGIEYLRVKFLSVLHALQTSSPNLKNLTPSQVIEQKGTVLIHSFILRSLIADIKANQSSINEKINKLKNTSVEKQKERLKKQIDTGTGIVSNLTLLLNTFIDSKDLSSALKEGKIKAIEINGEKQPAFAEYTPLLERFNHSLRIYGIKMGFDSASDFQNIVDEETSFDRNIEENTFENIWGQNTAEIDHRTTMDNWLRIEMATLPVLSPEGKYIRNVFGAPKTHNFGEVFSYIGKRITDSGSPSQMMTSLLELSNEKTFVRSLTEKISKYPVLKTKLWLALGAKTFQDSVTVYEENGQYIVFNSNRKNLDQIVKETLIAGFLVEGNELFYKHKQEPQKGQRNFEHINLTKLKPELKKINALLEEVKEIKGVEQSKAFISKFAAFLNKNHITINEHQLLNIWNPSEVHKKSRWANIINVVSITKKIFDELEKEKNPFLTLKPTEQILSTKKDRGGNLKVLGMESLIGKLGEKIKSGLEKETVDSYQNAEGKSQYAIQLSNHLNKLLNKFKNVESIEKYLNTLKNDPLVYNLPFFQDLLGEEGIGTHLIDNLEVVIFDALARRGKSKAIDYKNLSDIEMEAVSLAMFFNNGQKVARYKLPTPSDATTLPFITYGKFTNEEIIEKLFKTAQAEQARIINVKATTKNNLLRLFANYFKRATKFQILSFLNGKATEYSTPNEIRELIVKHLEEDFLKRELTQKKKLGIIKSYDLVKNEIVFADKLISTKVIGNKADFYVNYLYNSFYFNTQITTVFAGDPSFYKNTVNYQKRFKQIVSPGQYTNHEHPLVPTSYNGLILDDSYSPSKKEVVDEIIKVFKESKFLTPAKKKELIALWTANYIGEKKKDLNNETDGATFIDIDRYMTILHSEERVTEAHKEAAQRIREGKENAKDIALFPPIKPFVFTQRIVEGVQTPFQLKNSEVLLTKAFAHRKNKDGKFKYPKLVEAYKLLSQGIPQEGTNPKPVNFIAFLSAAKVGALGYTLDEQTGDPLFSTLEKSGDGYILSGTPNLITIQQEDWRRQQETPSHYIDDIGNFGTQLRSLIIAGIDFKGTYLINGQKIKGKQVVEEYQRLIMENLKDSFAEVEEIFLTKDGEINYTKLAEHLKREIIDRDLPQDYIDAVEPITDALGNTTTALPLWHPAISLKVEALLNSFFKNKITKQKMPGGNMVNATSYGVSHTLDLHVKDGIVYLEALLPWWSKKYFPQNEDGEVDIEAIRNVDPRLLEVLGYRIPTEDKYSMFSIKAVGFTDSASGGAIILPAQITKLAGLDFDIDKLFMFVPSFRLEKGKPVYIEYMTKDTPIDTVVENIVNSVKSFNRFVKKFVGDKGIYKAEDLIELREELLDTRYKAYATKADIFESDKHKKLYNDILRYKLLINQEVDEDRKQALKTKKSDLYIQLEEDYLGPNEIISEVQEEFEELKTTIKDFIIKNKIDFELLNGKKERDNQLLRIMIGILENKHTAISTLEPGGFAKTIELANKIRLLSISDSKLNPLRKKAVEVVNNYKANKISVEEYRTKLIQLTEELDEKDFNINYPSTQMELFRRNMTGVQLTGIFANHITHHAKSQYTSLELEKDIVFDGNFFSKLNQVYSPNNNRISRSLATILAAVLDNAQEPTASFLNMNTYTADTIALLVRLGVEEDTAFSFIAQPAIVQLTYEYFNQKGSLSNQKVLLQDIKTKWIKKILDKKFMTEEEINNLAKLSPSERNLTLAELDASLNAPGTARYYQIQLAALFNFEDYQATARELGGILQAARVDTIPMGPTYGHNYIMLRKQDRIRSKQKPKINGAEEFFVESSEQKLNPSFNKWAWLEGTNILNKIYPYIGTINTDTGAINYSILGKIKNIFSDLKGPDLNLTDKEARTIDIHFMTFLASSFPIFNYKNAKEILQEVPQKVQQWKIDNPDSLYNEFLDQIYPKAADKNSAINRLEFYNTGRNNLDTQYFKNIWAIMLESNIDSERELALDLVKYAYFSSGFSFNPFSFFHIIPVKFWTDKFAKASENKQLGLLDSKGRTFNEVMKEAYSVLTIENEGKTETKVRKDPWVNTFLKQFAQNIAKKSFLIPQLSNKVKRVLGTKENIGELYLDSTEAKKIQLPTGEMPMFLKTGTKVTKLYVLTKKELPADPGAVVYRELPLLGSTNFVVEYNIYSDINKSVVDDISKEFRETEADDFSDVEGIETLAHYEGEELGSFEKGLAYEAADFDVSDSNINFNEPKSSFNAYKIMYSEKEKIKTLDEWTNLTPAERENAFNCL